MIGGIVRDDKNLEYTTTVDEVEYTVDYSVWIWNSPDGTEQNESIVTINNTTPYLDDESYAYSVILEEFVEMELKECWTKKQMKFYV